MSEYARGTFEVTVQLVGAPQGPLGGSIWPLSRKVLTAPTGCSAIAARSP